MLWLFYFSFVAINIPSTYQMNHLLALSKLLLNLKLYKEAQKAEELSEYAEPWHEEAAKEFGEEPISEDEYLEKNLSYSPKSPVMSGIKEKQLIEMIFKKHKIHLVSESGKSAVLGSGVSGQVFSVIYQGKPAVAKVIITAGPGLEDEEMESESENWNFIMDHRSKLSTEAQKHVPEIIDIISGEIEKTEEEKYPDTYYPLINDFQYEVIIMEKLYPIPSTLRKFFYQTFGNSDTIIPFHGHYLSEKQKEKLEKIKADPAMREYVNALQQFSELGLVWGDLHDKNVMMGSDGNLKILDIGGWTKPEFTDEHSE